MACLASFQALFTQPQKKKQAPKDAKQLLDGNRPRTFGSSGKASKPKGWSLYDTIVDTCHDLEGVTHAGSHDTVAAKQGSGFDDLEAGRSRVGDSSRDDSFERLPLDSYCMNERYVKPKSQPIVVDNTMRIEVDQPTQAYQEPGHAR